MGANNKIIVQLFVITSKDTCIGLWLDNKHCKLKVFVSRF